MRASGAELSASDAQRAKIPHRTRAAALLGLNRDQIRYRIEKFGLSTVPQMHRVRRPV
jgi:hypothetical protein